MLYIRNDLPRRVFVLVEVDIIDFDYPLPRTVLAERMELHAGPAVMEWRVLGDLLRCTTGRAGTCCIRSRVSEMGGVYERAASKLLAENLQMSVPPYSLELPHALVSITDVHTNVRHDRATVGSNVSTFVVSSDKLALYVAISTPWPGTLSDNYFTLLPNERVKLEFKHQASLADAAAFADSLRVDHLGMHLTSGLFGSPNTADDYFRQPPL